MKKIFEAKKGITGPKTENILGVGVSGTDKNTLLNEIQLMIGKKTYTRPFFIITAYSENILEAGRDVELKAAFEAADRVVGDGVVVPAAIEYLKSRDGDVWGDLWKGFEVGGKILRGEYVHKKIVGVKLTDELLRIAVQRKWKVVLLGGFNGVADRLAIKYGGNIKTCEEPELMEINKFAPDLLLVALGRFKQEKWIAANLKNLRAKVVIGVGSSFDELVGEGVWKKHTPEWVEKMGLKWLWRITLDPKHIRRAWNAFPVFAWKVFRSI